MKALSKMIKFTPMEEEGISLAASNKFVRGTAPAAYIDFRRDLGRCSTTRYSEVGAAVKVGGRSGLKSA